VAARCCSLAWRWPTRAAGSVGSPKPKAITTEAQLKGNVDAGSGMREVHRFYFDLGVAGSLAVW